MVIIDEILNPVRSMPLSEEQCVAQNMPYPAYIVTTMKGIKAALHRAPDHLIAIVPLSSIQNVIDTLAPINAPIFGKGYQSVPSIKTIKTKDYQGIVMVEGGKCVIQVSI